MAKVEDPAIFDFVVLFLSHLPDELWYNYIL
jgi:hypothetical protein